MKQPLKFVIASFLGALLATAPFVQTAHAEPALHAVGLVTVFDGNGGDDLLGVFKAVYTLSTEGVLKITLKASGIPNPSHKALHFDVASTDAGYLIPLFDQLWFTTDWYETLSASGEVEIHIQATDADLL
jgi:hypothetical protein